MKPLIVISIIITCFLASAFRHYTNPVYITGHIRRNSSQPFFFKFPTSIIVKNCNKIIAKGLTDDKGDFTLSFTAPKENSLDFFCSGVGIDTFLLESFIGFDNDTPEMTLYLPAQPLKDSLGKVICPKCKKADKVYPIDYGDSFITRHINQTGDTTYKVAVINGRYQRGGCKTQPAQYYCDRDGIKF